MSVWIRKEKMISDEFPPSHVLNLQFFNGAVLIVTLKISLQYYFELIIRLDVFSLLINANVFAYIM